MKQEFPDPTLHIENVGGLEYIFVDSPCKNCEHNGNAHLLSGLGVGLWQRNLVLAVLGSKFKFLEPPPGDLVLRVVVSWASPSIIKLYIPQESGPGDLL